MNGFLRTRSPLERAGRGLVVVSLLAICPLAHPLEPYPLDGAERSGIRRLSGYLATQDAASGAKLPAGALLGTAQIRLHLTASPELDIDGLDKDPVLQRAIETMFARRDASYSIAVVDITDPERLVWAAMRESRAQLPGSVGKLGVMVALFDGLRRAFPDASVRERVLREHVVEASDWAVSDSHTVPKYDPESGRNRSSRIVPGDRFTLSEWVDHMISASANSAGSMVWKEAMLLRHFGSAYPPSPEAETAFFRDTPKSELTELSLRVIDEPLQAVGITGDEFRQGTMFTSGGQRHVPGKSSQATPRGLVRMLLRIEQGRMVDQWSSLEMKRYLYMTKRRYRYVYAPELADSAVYFKSGSFYQCVEEEGFECGRYQGNKNNLMNSVVIVESPAEPRPEQKRYLVAMMSNVLRVNSAWDHSRIGAAIDEAVRTRSAVPIEDQGTEAEKKSSGSGD